MITFFKKDKQGIDSCKITLSKSFINITFLEPSLYGTTLYIPRDVKKSEEYFNETIERVLTKLLQEIK